MSYPPLTAFEADDWKLTGKVGMAHLIPLILLAMVGRAHPIIPAGILTYRKLRHAALGAVLTGALGACAWENPPIATEPAKPQTSLVEMVSGGLLRSGTGKPELGLTLANHSERTLWAQVRFRTPSGQHDCLLGKELEPKSKGDYLCPQSTLQADSDYPVQIVVFGDRVQTQVLERLNTRFRFSREDVRAAGGK